MILTSGLMTAMTTFAGPKNGPVGAQHALQDALDVDAYKRHVPCSTLAMHLKYSHVYIPI